MTPCIGYFPKGNRQCERPADHTGEHGNLLVQYQRFRPPQLLAEYAGKHGSELGGLRLDAAAYAAIADAKVSGDPPALVVIGEYQREDGQSFLDYGAPTGYIETVSNHRWDENVQRLRLVCPDCGMKDGKHSKGCER